MSSIIAESNYVWLWATIATLLMVDELLAVHGFFLSFSLACGVIALLLYTGVLDTEFLWQIFFVFVLGTVFFLVVRRSIKSMFDQTQDINRY